MECYCDPPHEEKIYIMDMYKTCFNVNDNENITTKYVFEALQYLTLYWNGS